jgi:hypothetical protein
MAGEEGVTWEDLGDWGAPSMPEGAADEHKGQFVAGIIHVGI